MAAEALSRLYAAARLYVNFCQPSFKLASKTRVGAHVSKRYHAPQTPCQRLLASEAVPEEVKAKLRETAAQLDPLRLLEEIRKMQGHLVSLVDHGAAYTPVASDSDLTGFLTGLSTAWRSGEARPTHRVKPKPTRYWRTRLDPFESVWPELVSKLEEDPDLTAKELFAQLQQETPDAYQDGQLRTLQRRVKEWRIHVARRLVFGVHDNRVGQHTPLLEQV